MVLHGAELEHRLKAVAAASVMHNRMVIIVRCRG